MSVKKQIEELSGTYFITITCFKWLHLFELGNSYSSVYNWFDYLKLNGNYINGYVIMPNHLHALISFHNNGKNINKQVGEGKRFMAYDIIKNLERSAHDDLLKILSENVRLQEKKKGKLHEVFESSFDIKECYSWEIIKQKLDYIHFNPCTGKWHLVDSSEDYMHSSALFYSSGMQRICAVKNIMDMMDIDLG